ncbi:hypothetical protein ASD19_08020 [Microbacterium sp. Root53]|uniref:hypothetical protein n=1 Tax=Microbacterium sp. Root53 TaxID=1736553 RepID=UPI0006F1F3F2|nr:hypothetical protein [Microbacterium sp. Root53]KQY96887.1 hypothetical protein ASD19_08020 [Microbacterium sp. Root53]
MLSRRVSLVVAGLLLAGLTGCTPTPAPTPTPTGFASEDEAFAAAEETYRAYVDELNAYHAGDPGADPLKYFSGEMREREAELMKQSEDAGLRTEGDLKIVSVDQDAANVVAGAATIHLIVCHDSSDRRLVNADGDDVTLEDVPTRFAFDVEFTTVDRSELVIIDSVLVDEDC